MKVLLLGATGMLGSAVYSALHDKHDLILGFRSPARLRLLNEAYPKAARYRAIAFDAETFIGNPEPFLEELGHVDWVINAAGVTIPFAKVNPLKTYLVNGVLPHVLSRYFGRWLIQITTDCVFDGKEGFPYTEQSPKTAVDIYGASKSIGEPLESIVFRTSIIGRELNGFTGLLEWFLQQRGKTITGFSEHYWNGITALQFGRICREIMEWPMLLAPGVYHIFSTTVSKYEMLLAFERKYRIGCTIIKDETNKLNRTLATTESLSRLLRLPSFREMLEEL